MLVIVFYVECNSFLMHRGGWGCINHLSSYSSKRLIVYYWFMKFYLILKRAEQCKEILADIERTCPPLGHLPDPGIKPTSPTNSTTWEAPVFS